VRFRQAYFDAVSRESAGTEEAGILALLAIEVWGLPTSPPTTQPGTPVVVQQRFQRGIVRYDSASGRTAWLPLADFLKQLLRNDPTLPRDLWLQGRDGRLFAQYCPEEPGWLCRPRELPDTDLTYAFEPG
jgi:hypothetical protein